MNDIQRRLQEFIRYHQTTAWLIVLVGAGVLLQLVLYLGIGLLNKPGLYPEIISYLMLPADWKQIVFQPWSVFTWPFVYFNEGFGRVDGGFAGDSYDFLRMLFDVLILYGFGRIHQQLLGEQRTQRLVLLTVPLLGLLTWFISTPLGPRDASGMTFLYLNGLTPIVTVIVASAATFLPNYPVRVLIFGQVRIMWVAIVLVLLELLSAAFIMTPTGVAIALGAIAGFFHGYSLKQGNDLTQIVWDFYGDRGERSVKPQKRVAKKRAPQATATAPSASQPRADDSIPQEEIDRILDKIGESGYDSLSRREKELLLRASSRDDHETP